MSAPLRATTVLARSVRYYWRTHLGVILGAALGALVLTGALLVGDSVKATLVRQAELRVGAAETAMTSGDRFFRSALAEQAGPDVAPVLMLRATVARADGKARVNSAQLLGVDERFWKLAPEPRGVSLSADQVALNSRLAQQLSVAAGDTVVIRVEKPGLFSKDAPLSGDEADSVALRVKVGQIIEDEQYGRFSLAASQVPPFSVFVPLQVVQEKVALAGKANLLLKGQGGAAGSLQTLQPTLDDYALQFRELPNASGFELRTPRVFLDPPVVSAAPELLGRRVDALTYFVNGLYAGDRSTPYSMVTAVETPSSGFLPAELADDEIVLSQWEAEDLNVTTGAKVTLKYFVMGERRQLEEKSREFTVLAILPMNEPHLNPSWMPDFPGLSDKQNCRDWEPGFDFDSTRMRDKDQEYWEQYQGTPKAFVNLKVGQEMWANRWGQTTSLRWPAGTAQAEVEAALRKNLQPAALGFQTFPLREQALAATKAPVDFGQLFVSFSGFLIIAAAALTGMLFVFSLEQRNAEAGLLLALGLRPKQVRRMFLLEGAALALIGSALGAAGAVIYTRLVLHALSTVWRGAVGSVDFQFAPQPMTLAIGVVSGVVIAVLAMWWASRKQMRHSARELLGGEMAETAASLTRKSGRAGWVRWAAPILLIAAIAMAFFGGKAPGIFFGAGGLLLIAGLLFALGQLRQSATGSGLPSLRQLGVRNAGRRRGRSLATIGVLASGVFMVVAVDSFRHSPNAETTRRDSGTGGFALIGTSALPIYDDLNTPKGRQEFALDDAVLKDVSVVPMRVRDGDDASCLNLNRAVEPRLLGVRPSDLASRGAFNFNAPDGASWDILETADDGVVPGVVDAATLQWALQKRLGDILEYRDERGSLLRIRLAATVSNSILQGSVVIAEQHFVRSFPSQGGYRALLVDAPADRAEAVREELSRGLQDRGLELTSASRRLGEFQAVENTYLSIFQVLGGLGLLLGSAGLAIVVARNVLERRREFGLLEAVGFRPQQMRQLVFAEHRWLIFCGLAIGAASALLAVWPNLRERASGFPYVEIALLLGALLLGCIFWAWLATRLALRGSGLVALRSE